MELLQSVAGPSYPVLFLKAGRQDWVPVGAEELYSVVPGKGGTAALVLCDAEGNAKAMSAWVGEAEAERWCKELEARSVAKYGGEVKLPV